MMRPIPAVLIDQWTYILIAFFGAWTAALSTDEAAKFIVPAVLFWLKSGCASLSASLLALKMFRSTGFAAHQAEVKKKEETQFFPKPSVPAP